MGTPGSRADDLPSLPLADAGSDRFFYKGGSKFAKLAFRLLGEAVDRFHQSEVAFLKQFEHGNTRRGVLLSDI